MLTDDKDKNEVEEAPVVLMFAGPNGSGKSTITGSIVEDPELFSGEYINADEIAKSLAHEISDVRERSIRAAEIAEERRVAALRDGRDFAFETVMSTPEKVALLTQAKARGYEVNVIFVTTSNPEINVQRVATRVLSGGHDVPPDIVRRRYADTLNLVAAAFEHADVAVALDNTGSEPVRVAVKDGEDSIVLVAEGIELYEWVEEKLHKPFLERMASRRLLVAQVPEGAVATNAVAENGLEYSGLVLSALSHHVLQKVGDQYVIHDRQLTATTQFQVGQDQVISYRYEYGKIVPDSVSAPSPVPRP